MTRLSKFTIMAMCMIGAPLQAHEFWIEAEDYTAASGTTVSATFRNGQELSGAVLSYIPARSARFDMVVGQEVVPVSSRIGNNPAFQVAGLPDGLLTVIQETTAQTLVYSEWEKWVKFTEHKDFTFAQQAHIDRGLPQEGFKESYLRYAKALIAVGDGAGSDARRGLRAEIVAGANPYTDDLSGGLPVQVFFDDAPKANAQVEMFAKAPNGEVEVTLHRTDADGRVTLPVVAGHEYLLDSVTVLPVEPALEGDPVWQTHWAALTFAVPQ
ncbi:DUF4198 domain-containing protein [Jannaschia pohangensis]|uniref:Uncharacterized conserved protein, contains GH25 family domain n=1 Tax=Jannaschia pohangensis TaxID=390807 RepID=A0A1I3TL15_9RHOB|nr:DUF4198 domain-containing protein [Jannaschia pohangensis]SFJ70311.1 Uncharacterized conserved protein, contains GH25 family domain [Jannaschia pohangensis]